MRRDRVGAKAHGPHVPGYIPLKQRVLQAAIRERAKAGYAQGESAYEYRPTGRYAVAALREDGMPPTFRYPHGEYWRRG